MKTLVLFVGEASDEGRIYIPMQGVKTFEESKGIKDSKIITVEFTDGTKEFYDEVAKFSIETL